MSARYCVIATNIQTGAKRIIADNVKTEEDAEAIVRLAVYRRGVEVEFFKVALKEAEHV